MATNVSAGSDYRFALLWTVVAASATAALVQYLSAKLGLATGLSLAELCRDHTATASRIALWLVAEVVVISTDLAEFVGGAVALNLMLGISPLSGGIIVAAAVMLVLRLRLGGRDAFPVVVVGLLFVITLAFGYLAIRTPLDGAAALSGLVPRLPDGHAALLSCGIVGATVMPHALFLHSSLVSRLERKHELLRTPATLRFLRRDVVVAMSLAGVVNALILLVATQLPVGAGNSLASAHSAFARSAGSAFALIFAMSLLASGLASACAGVYSGQAIMRGFLRRDSNVWVRRLVSTVPALLILALVHDPTQALVLSQVTLAFGLPFALVPLLVFTARGSVMGSFANRPHTTLIGATATAIVLALNVFVLAATFG